MVLGNPRGVAVNDVPLEGAVFPEVEGVVFPEVLSAVVVLGIL